MKLIAVSDEVWDLIDRYRYVNQTPVEFVEVAVFERALSESRRVAATYAEILSAFNGTPVEPTDPPMGQDVSQSRQDIDETASDQNPCK